MKTLKFSASALLVLALVFFACKKSETDSPTVTSAAKPSSALDPLSLTCDAVTSNTGGAVNLSVKAGASGAQAGFSIQWETLEDYNLYGWSQVNAPSYRCASLSGVPGCSGSNKYSLAGDESVTVNIGDNLFDDCGASANCGLTGLNCGTVYVFRAFAHNVPGGLKASDKSGTTTCTTLPCGTEGCTLTQGYWKTHNPLVCETIAASPLCIQWPVTSLILGTTEYDVEQLLSILNTQPKGGNGLVSLAHQLIAAKLNIAKGSDGSAITQAIADADALIGNLVIAPVGSGFLASSLTSDLNTALTNYNEGKTGPGHCK